MAISAKVSGIGRQFSKGKGETGHYVTVTDDAYPGIAARFDYAREGEVWRLATLSVTRHDGPLAAGAMREMPLARWQRTADEHLRAADERRGKPSQQLSPQLLRLAEVAGAYRANLAAGLKDPVGAIARDYDVKPTTARSWVHRARKAGLLGAAISRSAGEELGKGDRS